MRDKLAEVICRAMFDQPLGELHPLVDAGCVRAADALREYLGSDEVVTDAARAMAAEINFSFDGFDERTQSKYLRQVRAALSSIMEQSDAR
jgi:hypothetical protein